MILAGDIGGTKTELAIFDSHDSQMRGPKFERRYLNREQDNLPAMVQNFLRDAGLSITDACFAVAGPVRAGRCVMPNLPWVVDGLVWKVRFHAVVRQVFLALDCALLC